MLFLFQKVYFDIVYHNKSCVKNSLDAAFIPIAIPFEAQHRAQVVLGSLSAPAQGLLVNNWVGTDAEINGKLETLTLNITLFQDSMTSTRFILFSILLFSKLLPDLYRVRLHSRRHLVSDRRCGSFYVKVGILKVL